MKTSHIRLIFGILAVAIVTASLLFSNKLVKNLASEEQKKMQTWADAMQLFNNVDNNSEYFSFLWQILEQNENIPVIIADKNDHFISQRNYIVNTKDSVAFFTKKIQELKNKNEAIRIYIAPREWQNIYYDDSNLLKLLSYYPYIQLLIITIFLVVLLLSFAWSKKSEQNKVWVGLSKETAHQLGTPISSLLAWVEILKTKHESDSVVNEMGKDVGRLKTIAERFSKIGSKPEFVPVDFCEMVENSLDYMKTRSSNKVIFEIEKPQATLIANVNTPLLEWVIENLCKNSIDAMDGEGRISVAISTNEHNIIFDFSDTGKGIDKKNFKSVFKPGFTTKKRGWGLGLSLAKRIVCEYHRGKIFIKSSEKNVGTTFRIILPIANN